MKYDRSEIMKRACAGKRKLSRKERVSAMKNLKLETCMRIFSRYDIEMYKYLEGRKESELNMAEVSGYARDLRDANKK